MKTGIDVDRYFERIGYAGNRAPTLETLRTLHVLHPQAIPFENLDPFLHVPLRLDSTSLQEKLLAGRRGGYCYEHNLLLKGVLEALGFQVKGLAARVVMNAAPDEIRPRTHMLLLLNLAGESWIADVGFGGLTPTAPLRLVEGDRQSTPHEPYRLLRHGEDYVLQAEVRGEWRALYRFDLQEQFLPDYELASWYLSNHPGSHFVTGLTAARAVPGRRYALSNAEFAVHGLHGDTVRRRLADATELRRVLEEIFGIALPDDKALEQALARITAPPDESA